MRHFWTILLSCAQLCAHTLTIATYNVETYIDTPFHDLEPKSEISRKAVRDNLRAINADIIALQEIGSTNALFELRSALASEGLAYQHWEWIQGHDTNLHLAFLSRLPILARHPYTNDSFLYAGRRHYVGRGFAEIEIEPSPGARLALISAHLKSKRMVIEADQESLREEEATLLREHVDSFLKLHPQGNLVVLGDLNDTIASRAVRTILGRGRTALFDPRPAERNADIDLVPTGRYPPRRIIWTHYFAKEETYSRLDYILLSQSLRSRVDPAATFLPRLQNWGTASDHRPVVLGLTFD